MKNILLILGTLAILIVSGCATNTDFNTDLCKQKVTGEGLCEAYFEGFQYDSASESCIKQGVSGCSLVGSPFNSLEACQLACEK